MPELIYGNVDIAEALEISPQSLSNHVRRHANDVPAPAYVTRSGIAYWTAEDLPAWQEWRATVSIRGRRVPTDMS